MKVLSIILTCALLGVMGWLVLDSRSEARGTRNQLELLRRQQDASTTTIRADENELAALEKQLISDQQTKKSGAAPSPAPAPGEIPVPGVAPSSAPLSTAALLAPTLPAPTMKGSTPAVTAALEAAAAAPPPLTPRQRQIAAAPAIAEVKHYEKEYGFVAITGGTARKIEAGMGFAIRRGDAIIARIKVTEVENESAVASVDSNTLPPGVLIEVGDEVIQDLPPQS